MISISQLKLLTLKLFQNELCESSFSVLFSSYAGKKMFHWNTHDSSSKKRPTAFFSPEAYTRFFLAKAEKKNL